MPERRYDEDEVAEIFGRATKAEEAVRRQVPRTEGMTLAELQEIGREVGIAPDRVAEAARALTLPATRTTRRFLGVTIGVGRTVELGRQLSDEEWERVVVLLRETFDARGSLKSHGSLREWTNGNLQVLLEPSAQGHKLRLRTTHGPSQALMMGGTAMIALSAVLTVATELTVGFANADGIEGMLSIALLGVGSFLAGVIRLPSWVRERRKQMDEIAATLTSGDPTPP